jgi:hypothetical protein
MGRHGGRLIAAQVGASLPPHSSRNLSRPASCDREDAWRLKPRLPSRSRPSSTGRASRLAIDARGLRRLPSRSRLAVETTATIAKSTFVDWTGEQACDRRTWSAQADLARVAATSVARQVAIAKAPVAHDVSVVSQQQVAAFVPIASTCTSPRRLTNVSAAGRCADRQSRTATAGLSPRSIAAALRTAWTCLWQPVHPHNTTLSDSWAMVSLGLGFRDSRATALRDTTKLHCDHLFKPRGSP